MASVVTARYVKILGMTVERMRLPHSKFAKYLRLAIVLPCRFLLNGYAR